MGKRTYESDIIAMALLYRKEYVGTHIISYDKAVKFDKVINDNLDKMEAKYGIGIRWEEPSKLYSLMKDEKGELCAVINPNVDLKKMWKWHVYNLPAKVILASYMDNALKEIDLIEVNGKIIDRNVYYNNLRQKYNFVKETDKDSFDIFEEWQRIAEDGFVEKYCLSESEKNILKELRKNKQESSFTKIKK